MDAAHRGSAERFKAQLASGRQWDPAQFRVELQGVPVAQRDAWVDVVLGLEELPEDGPGLPRGCAPYLPCPVEALLQVVEHAPVEASDVFVDVGSGVGRAAALVHLLTGAEAVGIEVQSGLVRVARELCGRLGASGLSFVEGDAADFTGRIPPGSVFFLYCPFSGARLQRVLEALEELARTRPLCICCVNLPLPPCDWLRLEHSFEGDLAIYRTEQPRQSSEPGKCGKSRRLPTRRRR